MVQGSSSSTCVHVPCAGNFLNAGNRDGTAAGFQIDALAKLKDVRSSRARCAAVYAVYAAVVLCAGCSAAWSTESSRCRPHRCISKACLCALVLLPILPL